MERDSRRAPPSSQHSGFSFWDLNTRARCKSDAGNRSWRLERKKERIRNKNPVNPVNPLKKVFLKKEIYLYRGCAVEFKASIGVGLLNKIIEIRPKSSRIWAFLF